MLAEIDYVTLAQQFGIMGSLLVGVLLALYRSGKWVGSTILQPLANRHVVFLDKIERLQAEQSLVIAEIARTQAQQTVLLDQLKKNYEAGNKLLETLIQSRNDSILQILDGTREIIRRLDVLVLVKSAEETRGK